MKDVIRTRGLELLIAFFSMPKKMKERRDPGPGAGPTYYLFFNAKENE